MTTSHNVHPWRLLGSNLERCRVDDFDVSYARMINAGVRFLSLPRAETYGKVAVFIDLEGNRWDLLGPDPRAAEASP